MLDIMQELIIWEVEQLVSQLDIENLACQELRFGLCLLYFGLLLAFVEIIIVSSFAIDTEWVMKYRVEKSPWIS